MVPKSMREARRARRKKQQTIRKIIWATGGIILVIIIGYVSWALFKPTAGESVPIMANAGDHVPTGTNPGPYNSDPPTSGKHYAEEFDAGFYELTDAKAQQEFPEGYLNHNLEHGYVIFWYNCDLLDEAGCSELKDQIKGVMNDFDNYKVIGFPRNSIEYPISMTSWGRIQNFDSFDAEAASAFVRKNRNHAPEPNAS